MSTSRASLRMRLTAAQNGLDPRTHYWYRASKNDYRRICDDTDWQNRIPGAAIGLVCGPCLSMRRTDREEGSRAFSLTYRRNGVFAGGLADTMDDHKEARTMRVTMFKFAEFCVGSDSERARIIAKRKDDQRRKGGGDYYSALRVCCERSTGRPTTYSN